jgi:acetyl esterase/lipase
MAGLHDVAAREVISSRHVCADGSSPHCRARVSPLAADLAGLGPLTIFSGTRDLLNPDARLLVDKATAAEVDVDYRDGASRISVR